MTGKNVQAIHMQIEIMANKKPGKMIAGLCT